MASSALLAEIQKGKGLKKTQTNDRSAPTIDGSNRSGGGTRNVLSNGSSSTIASAGVSSGAPQLGGLFAGGIPKLKPAGSTPQIPAANLAKVPVLPKRDNPSTPIRPPTKPAAPPPPPPPVAAHAAPAIPTRPPTRPAAPAPPSRPPARTPPPPTAAAPALPSRNVPQPPPTTTSTISAPPEIPRRPPPPALSSGSNDPPAIPARTQTQSTPPISLLATKTPISSGSSRTPPPLPPGRSAPPPPPPSTPPRPASAAPHIGTPTRGVPPPPPVRRTVEESVAPALPARTRAISSIDKSPSSLGSIPFRPSAPAPERQRAVSTGAPAPPLRTAPFLQPNGPPKTGARYPTPPPTIGSLTFAVTDFPAPRPFSEGERTYPSGRSRGSGFKLSGL